MVAETEWSYGGPLAGAASSGSRPAATFRADTLHVIWSFRRVLLHAWKAPGHNWSQPVRVAAGDQPALGLGPDGDLHCLFTHQFGGNHEIYHVSWDSTRWSLPEPVSRTSGMSVSPALAIGSDGSLHAAWSDTTPGYQVIYYGRKSGPFWSSVPIPSGRGSSPVIALTPEGHACVAWQDRITDSSFFDIFLSIAHAGAWSPPELVSDSKDRHSLSPAIAVAPSGELHLVWQEENRGYFSICHSGRWHGAWTVVTPISDPAVDSRLARVNCNPKGYVQVCWMSDSQLVHRSRPPAPDSGWWELEDTSIHGHAVSSLGAAIDDAGALAVVLAQFGEAAEAQLTVALREPLVKHRINVPD